MLRLFIIALMLTQLAACQSTNNTNAHHKVHVTLHDEAFPTYHQYIIETEEEVFHLDQDAKRFVADAIAGSRDITDQMESLVRSIFDHSELDLLYMGSANTVASETFRNGAANCLSMSIMTYAMAKEAGFFAKFQDIMIPEYWTRRDGYSLLNGHINLVIEPRKSPNIIHFFEKGFEVDFDPQNARSHFPKRLVGQDTVLAMFYNNKGADALVNGLYDKAYAYFREALIIAPNFDSVWVNLGILYRINGYLEYAEESYRQAIDIDNDNLTAWENLAYLYQLTQNKREGDRILALVNRKRQDNPYYHFILGEQEFDREHWNKALRHYRDALKVDKTKHEIFFGLAKVYYELGDVSRSQYYLKLAKRKSTSRQDQEKYQGKLDLLSRR